MSSSMEWLHLPNLSASKSAVAIAVKNSDNGVESGYCEHKTEHEDGSSRRAEHWADLCSLFCPPVLPCDAPGLCLSKNLQKSTVQHQRIGSCQSVSGQFSWERVAFFATLRTGGPSGPGRPDSISHGTPREPRAGAARARARARGPCCLLLFYVHSRACFRPGSTETASFWRSSLLGSRFYGRREGSSLAQPGDERRSRPDDVGSASVDERQREREGES